MATKPKLSLNVQHEYITLRTPNGNFTMSWRGEKASGLLAKNSAASQALSDYITRERAAGVKNGEIMAALTKPEVLVTLWPDWDAEVKAVEFEVGDTVRMGEALFKKKYPGEYEVAQVKPKTVYVKLPDGSLVGFSKIDLEKVEKSGAI